MLTSRALLVPHLATMVVDEHRGHRTPMLEALRQEADRLDVEKVGAVVAVSARWDSPGPFQVGTGRHHRTLTDYSGFGVELRYDCVGHPRLARALVDAGTRGGVHVGPAERGVDSGVTVPLHFLLPRRDVRVVPLSVARRSAEECRAWGRILRETLAARPERVAFVVGGMLSHDAHAWSFRREVPEARAFDERALHVLSSGAWDALGSEDARVVERAKPEADLRHLEILRGFLQGGVPGELLCYESGPGVGAALMAFGIDGAKAAAQKSASP
jgi:aromatic ring-opening dioxygenase catalytic subunit (LigB family)